MKKIFFLLIFAFVLSSCQSTKDAFTLKKKPSRDEFLVEKKSPLVMPPDYGKLPEPSDGKVKEETKRLSNNEDIKKLLTNNDNSVSQKKNKKPSSLEKSILEKMN